MAGAPGAPTHTKCSGFECGWCGAPPGQGGLRCTRRIPRRGPSRRRTSTWSAASRVAGRQALRPRRAPKRVGPDAAWAWTEAAPRLLREAPWREAPWREAPWREAPWREAPWREAPCPRSRPALPRAASPARSTSCAPSLGCHTDQQTQARLLAFVLNGYSVCSLCNIAGETHGIKLFDNDVC